MDTYINITIRMFAGRKQSFKPYAAMGFNSILWRPVCILEAVTEQGSTVEGIWVMNMASMAQDSS